MICPWNRGACKPPCTSRSKKFEANRLGCRQAEPVRDKYLPAHSAREMFNHNLDLVVGLPKEPWKECYRLAGIDIPDREMSHIEHTHTGKRLLGLGV